MKAASRPFKARHSGGRCPVCKNRIVKHTLIVKLEKTATWIEGKRLIPHGGGKFFTNVVSADYAHAECMEDKDEAE